jgi:hypothetical protein
MWQIFKDGVVLLEKKVAPSITPRIYLWRSISFRWWLSKLKRGHCQNSAATDRRSSLNLVCWSLADDVRWLPRSPHYYSELPPHVLPPREKGTRANHWSEVSLPTDATRPELSPPLITAGGRIALTDSEVTVNSCMISITFCSWFS